MTEELGASGEMQSSREFGSLAGRVAIVTGGAGAIGRATADEFARAGAAVVASDLPGSDRAGLPDQVYPGGGSIEFFAADASDPEQVNALVKYTVAGHERLDIYFGNAGVNSSGRAHNLAIEEYRRVVSICMDANFYAVKYAVPHMRAQQRGVFLFTGSTAAVQGMPASVAYAMAKHGLIGLVQSIAIDYGEEGIRGLAILPGPTATPMLDEVWGTKGRLHDVIVAATAGKKLGRPEEQARVARFLVSDDASFLNGLAIPVDGGMSSGQMLLKELMAAATGRPNNLAGYGGTSS
jgi:NAD(P)-dependent dehydrogenase (short-subunit alcohol dehydrogenase family)